MKRIVSALTILISGQYLFLFSQVKEPLTPIIPSINDQINLQISKFRVRVTIQGRSDTIECDVELNSVALKTRDNRSLMVKDISKINILTWERSGKLKKSIFYPSRYEILFRDYRKEIINGNIESINRIKAGNKKFIYFYYYDYFKKGKWIHSESADIKVSAIKPADGCAVAIEFL